LGSGGAPAGKKKKGGVNWGGGTGRNKKKKKDRAEKVDGRIKRHLFPQTPSALRTSMKQTEEISHGGYPEKRERGGRKAD